MQVTIWGTRGTNPSFKSDQSTYGGNTTCIEVRTDNNDVIILDAGTGILSIAPNLLKEENKECSILFTHRHWDHIKGMTLFTPSYMNNWTINVYGTQYEDASLESTFEMLFREPYFPVEWKNIKQNFNINTIETKTSFKIGSALIETHPTNHPGGCLAYKITADDWTVFFSGDHEWENEVIPGNNNSLVEFMKDCDLIIGDSHYFKLDYPKYIGWGHSTKEQWVERVLQTNASSLVFTHHHPNYSDAQLKESYDTFMHEYQGLPFRAVLSYEGMVITKDVTPEATHSAEPNCACRVCSFNKQLSQYADYNVIMESILTEARTYANAEGGTLYLLDELDPNKLIFAYTQNDALFSKDDANKALYLDKALPLTDTSIAGYVSIHNTRLNIANVYELNENLPYKFNKSFDEESGYKSISMLTVPLLTEGNKVVGALQLINSRSPEGDIIPFTADALSNLESLAYVAGKAIDQNLKDNHFISRILETSALRDPTETATHVMRVGSISAELYQKWAEKHNIPLEEIRAFKSNIKQAAMLHDLGKVSVSDLILKKPGRFTDEEREIMKKHSYSGAKIFEEAKLPIDKIAFNICLHHHQRWDGKGYTGHPDYPALSGTDIPLEARIVAVADVYDALANRRCYKEAFSKDDSIDILLKDSGTAFDPEIVETFMEIRDVVDVIMHRYSDVPPAE